MQTVKITKKMLETIATHSLTGKLLTEGIIPSETDKDIKLEFEIFSVAECADNGGPDTVIIPEYVPACLIQDVISLIKNGYNVEVGYFSTEK